MARYIPKFLLSAMAPEHFPAVGITHNAPEIAFLGRSNVGKSSLINALLGSRQAHVSSTPGRTRSINFFGLYEPGSESQDRPRPAMLFADLPGYGYAKISRSISAEWPRFIEPYLAERPTLALCVCLVDTNIPPQESDSRLIEFLQHVGRPLLVVGTKSDRMSANKLNQSAAVLRKALGVEAFLPVSVKNSLGIKQLWSELQEARIPSLP